MSKNMSQVIQWGEAKKLNEELSKEYKQETTSTF
jgi:hypothetical protein